jgi:hypothetical protein
MPPIFPQFIIPENHTFFKKINQEEEEEKGVKETLYKKNCAVMSGSLARFLHGKKFAAELLGKNLPYICNIDAFCNWLLVVTSFSLYTFGCLLVIRAQFRTLAGQNRRPM